MTRPRPSPVTVSSYAISQMRYSSGTGITASCAATWKTLSADVYTMGDPVRRCSGPSCSMIAVPDAAVFPIVFRPIRRS